MIQGQARFELPATRNPFQPARKVIEVESPNPRPQAVVIAGLIQRRVPPDSLKGRYRRPGRRIALQVFDRAIVIGWRPGRHE